MAINEIPLKERFKKENIILAGIWQGKGQPPYFQYVKEFSSEMAKLLSQGVCFKADGGDTETVARLCPILGGI